MNAGELGPSIVGFDAREQASGRSMEGLASLEFDGTNYYDNTLLLAVPTSGGKLSRLSYMFALRDEAKPFELTIDYGDPTLQKYIAGCR